MKEITAEELRALLHYGPETGWFNWIVNRGRAKAGARAGNLTDRGYRAIKVNDKSHKEHRLAWLYITGAWPTKSLDHINGLKDDNRIGNLRECTQAQNMANKAMRSTSTSGHKGVSWAKHREKWRAGIRVNQEKIHLGYFTNLEDAVAARKIAEVKYQGEFAYKETK